MAKQDGQKGMVKADHSCRERRILHLAIVSSKGLSRSSLSSKATSPSVSDPFADRLLRGSDRDEACASLAGAAQLKVRLSEGLPNMICMMKVKGALECLHQ